jgi:hypothetical protein
MRKVEPQAVAPSIEETRLDEITGGCAVGGCYGGGCASSYTYRQRGIGIDPMFMILAMSLLANQK